MLARLPLVLAIVGIVVSIAIGFGFLKPFEVFKDSPPTSVTEEPTATVEAVSFPTPTLRPIPLNQPTIALTEAPAPANTARDEPRPTATPEIAKVTPLEESQIAFLASWGGVTGDGQFASPHGIAVDGSGNVYLADVENNRVQKFTSSGQFLTKWGSHGRGDGQFESPFSIAVDDSGNIYVTDSGDAQVQKFSSSGTFLDQVGNSW